MLGKEIRMRKIVNPLTGKMLIAPIDHGISDGPIKGLINPSETIELVSTYADSVIMHKGLVSQSVGKMNGAGLIVHLSAGTMIAPDKLEKTIVTTVEEAISLGADAISVHMNVGAPTTSKMMEDMGKVSRDCARFGMPLVMMMYPRGERVTSESDVEMVKIAARIGAELGADIVKTVYTGDKESFKEVVAGCHVPVVIAGGSKGTDKEILQNVRDAMDAGAAGVAMGRNSFQHDSPKQFLKAVSLIIHKEMSVDDAMKESGLK
ncbi:MAG: 2-amino-3,7-dideoxy-D-threo-hept-6-ulosonate synthase [archaeon]|jgi:fructose-bisphosphate aldolase/2-amino-3,7-dideoxy-D-threo-hept-6-ulosonate synthase